MCGIAGWLGPSPAGAETQLRAMAHSLRHRGPDGEGFWQAPLAGFAHRRLSIIDIALGAQPLFSHDRRYVICYNGEIYNYRALRGDLEKRGHRFVTQSDTEVIVELFRAHDIEGFGLLRGMYAFALWDCESQRGVLVRDPYGIKPLFVCLHGDRLLFGSEAKAMLPITGRARLDVASMHLLLNFRYLPGTRTLFEGVRQLAPGEILEWHQGVCRSRSIPVAHAAIEPVPSLLEQAVQRNLVADVEVGAYLSGGVDSGLVCALAARSGGNAIRSFTLPVGDDPREAENAAETAQALAIVNIRGSVMDDAARVVQKLVWHLETPKVNAWQTYELARHATRHVKVVLSGLGADELFYGYNAHSILSLLALAAKTGALAGGAGRLLQQISSVQGLQWSEPRRLGLMLRSLGNWPRVYGLLRNVWDGPDLRRQLYGPRLLEAKLPDAFSEIDKLWPGDADPVKAAASFELGHKMVNDLLWQEDRAGMALGLEVRVPYLDADLVETVKAIPRSTLMPRGRRKGYLREIARVRLPEHILRRRKSGFQVAAPQFVGGTLEPLVRDWLSDERIRRHGLFNPKFVHDVLRRKPAKGLRWHYFVIYLMLQAHMWIEAFETDASASAPA
jgi:asparagine synthase (glutamine-hydrolysing)